MLGKIKIMSFFFLRAYLRLQPCPDETLPGHPIPFFAPVWWFKSDPLFPHSTPPTPHTRTLTPLPPLLAASHLMIPFLQSLSVIDAQLHSRVTQPVWQLFSAMPHTYIHTAVILNSWDQNFVFHVNSLWLSSVLFVQVWPADPLFTWQSASNSGVCGTLIGVIWRRSGVPAHRKYLPGTDYVQAVGGVQLFPLGHSLIVGVGRRYHRIANITEIFTMEEARHSS